MIVLWSLQRGSMLDQDKLYHMSFCSFYGEILATHKSLWCARMNVCPLLFFKLNCQSNFFNLSKSYCDCIITYFWCGIQVFHKFYWIDSSGMHQSSHVLSQYLKMSIGLFSMDGVYGFYILLWLSNSYVNSNLKKK